MESVRRNVGLERMPCKLVEYIQTILTWKQPKRVSVILMIINHAETRDNPPLRPCFPPLQ